MWGSRFAAGVMLVFATSTVGLAAPGDTRRALEKAVQSLQDEEASAKAELQALERESASATTPDARKALRERRLAAQRRRDLAARARTLWDAAAGADLRIEGLSDEAAQDLLTRLEALRKEVADAFTVGEYGRTALHRAAVAGDAERVRRLLEVGLAVDALDDGGHQPLHLAAWNGGVDAAKALLDAGAPVEALSHKSADRKPVPAAVGKSPLSGVGALHIAAYTGNVPLVEVLLARGAKIGAQGDFCDGLG